MVVWLRRDKQGIGIPDGVVRRADWIDAGSLDAAYCAIAEMRAAAALQCEQEAVAIIDAANAQADRIREEAHEQSLAMFEEATEEWNRVLLKSTQEAHHQIRQQRQRMARIVISAVEKIVPVQDPQGIYRQVLRTLSKSIQAVRYVTVRVCPEEVAHAETALRELASDSPLAKLIEVAGDDRLARGACLVESDLGIIDLSLSSQLKALRAAIFFAVGEPPNTSASAPET